MLHYHSLQKYPPQIRILWSLWCSTTIRTQLLPLSRTHYLLSTPRPLLLEPRSFIAVNGILVSVLPFPSHYCNVWMNFLTLLDVTLTCQHHVPAASFSVVNLASER